MGKFERESIGVVLLAEVEEGLGLRTLVVGRGHEVRD